MAIDRTDQSPAVQRKIVYAGAMMASFAQAGAALTELAELDIPVKQIERVAKRIGQERIAERRAEVDAYQRLPLVEKDRSPREQVPEVVAVGFDGGRYQRRDDDRAAAKASKSQAGAAAVPENGQSDRRHWREYKAGCLMTLASRTHEQDPCPEIPATFIEPNRAEKLAKEIHGCRSPEKGRPFGGETTEETQVETIKAEIAQDQQELPDEPDAKPKRSRRRPGAPEVLVRSIVASSASSAVFALMLAALAWARGFAAARRKAFLGDGAACNWTVWRKYFSDYTPILDFIHLLSYVYAAAMAGRTHEQGWPVYVAWIKEIWRGEAKTVLADLRRRSEELGPPQRGDPEGSPPKVVAEAVSYLRNNLARMHYSDYRRAGLPITSSYLESTVKLINQRAKGTEKFWSESGGEAILQLRADFLSDTEPMTAFWQRRQAAATGMHRYSCAA